jgi:hypothetical protein
VALATGGHVCLVVVCAGGGLWLFGGAALPVPF